MFIYLSKKIAIPNCANLQTVAWNNDQGWIACGGDDGLLKVLKLESNNPPNTQAENKGAPTSQLSMNQTLEGHNGSLMIATWNRQHQKLTTSDSNGLIIVWILYKGMWYEEMINNRNKGLVTGMEWNKDGQKICIVYEDGAVILGSVDGNRIWGKEVKNTNLAHVQWSPDGKFLLFATTTGQLQLFDNLGTFVTKISNFSSNSDVKIASMHWYNGSRGYIQLRVPCLAICYEDGKVQILRDQKDQIFWNTSSNEKYPRSVERLVSMTSAGEYCLITTKGDEGTEQTNITVYNAIGTPLESKTLDFTPKFTAISKSNVLIANDDILFHWQLKLLSNAKTVAKFDALLKKDVKERVFHIDDIVTIGANNEATLTTADLITRSSSDDPIICIAASETVLVVARQSGTLLQYQLPSLVLENVYNIPVRPVSLALNCNSSRLSILDNYGVLKLFELEKKQPLQRGIANASNVISPKFTGGTLLDFERKDVWDIKWATDNPELFSIMEKTRLYIFKNLDPEEPLTCSGCKNLLNVDICEFENLQIKTVLLDDVILDPESPQQTSIVNFEVKWLRDLRDIIKNTGLNEAIQFAEDRPHTKLWKIIAEAGLQQLNFEVATKAFIKCQDYQGLEFIKRLKKLEDPAKKKAEIAAYCLNFDEAEKLYLDMDRKDLAVDIRMRMGDWFRVVQLIKTGGGGDDLLLEKAWNQIGDFYYDRQRWSQAVTYYVQGRNTDKLIELYYLLEDFENLEKIANGLSENHPQLKNLAQKFLSVGLSDQAVNIFMKLGDVPQAINSCVHLNLWSTAIELAEKHKFKDIENILNKYASHILKSNKKKEAIELYRKANYCQKSALLIFEIAKEAVKNKESALDIKKLYVLGALEIERYHNIQKSSRNNPTAALDGLLAEDVQNIAESKVLDNAWRGAEAYHFYVLAQKQFYQGQLESAVITADYLCEYEDIIDPVTIYSLLALLSLHAGFYGTCSKAMIKLEGIEGPHQQYYQDLALQIFTKYKPYDPEVELVVCSNCLGTMKEK
ncbi:WD repeat-containing protein 35 [Boothiomyces macroporosus]|uniref:WD repeat-containing protein 35 n=1 Tax=Boothiomyces macroporosus TaxID=261099 RepID=A0AAD5ULY9_9FUNG|nr:WD repeat-containing protein 35 [Boothiomyces macroporosus]